MDIKKLINVVCAYKGINQSELAKATEQTKQNFNHKLKRNDMKISELEKTVHAMGCRMVLSVISDSDQQIVYRVDTGQTPSAL